MSGHVLGPAWDVVLPDGSVVSSEQYAAYPTRLVSQPGSVLVVHLREGALVYWAGPDGVLEWLVTVDRNLRTGREVRRAGPGIRSPHIVRTWLPQDRAVVVVTDGPVEQALAALDRAEGCLRARAERGA